MATLQSQPQEDKVPKTGDKFRCQQCGMELTITSDCQCEGASPRLECCGQPLKKV